MEDSFKTLEKPAEGIYRDRNSRFLAFGHPVRSVDEINDLINGLKKKYHDARHHCYAYSLGFENITYRVNDDGEPSGTAGKPIYGQILSYDLSNILVVVVRYFGGTLLGTSGLINAYRSATADMLNKASVVTRFVEDHYQLSFSYEKLNSVMKVLKEENLVPVLPVYDALCSMQIDVRRSKSDRILGRLSVISGMHTQPMQGDDQNHRL
jgi:uncharacterized YigZ family protein